MILVFYIILALILIIAVLTLIIYSSVIQIRIRDLHIKSGNGIDNNCNENMSLEVTFKVGKLKWFKVKMNRNKIFSIYEKTKKFEYKNTKMTLYLKNKFRIVFNKIIHDREMRKSTYNFKINIEELTTELHLGTEDVILTSYLVAFISIIISNILPHMKIKTLKNIRYKIIPEYGLRNMYELKLSTTFKISIKNVVNIVLKITKMMKNESNNIRNSNVVIKEPYSATN